MRPIQGGNSQLYLVANGTYIAYVIALVVSLFVTDPPWREPPGGSVLGHLELLIEPHAIQERVNVFVVLLPFMALTLTLCLVSLLIVLKLAIGRTGFNARASWLLPGLGTLLSLFLFMIGATPGLATGGMDLVGTASVIQRARVELNEPLTRPESSTAIERRRLLRHDLAMARVGAWGLLTWTLLCLLTTVHLARYTVMSCLRGLPERMRTLLFSEHRETQATASGYGYLGHFRLLFGILWVLLGTMVLMMLALVGHAGLEAVTADRLDLPFLDLPHASTATTFLLNLALDRNLDDRAFSPAVRVMWFSLGFVCTAGLVCSLGQLVLARRRALLRLRASARASQEKHNRAQRILDTLLRRTTVPAPPRLVISHSRLPFALSHAFGLRRPCAFIEVSSRCLEILPNLELEALIAHELAHHIRGDCRTDGALRFLGRVTLVGDATGRALQDTFGSELAADRVAITHLAADPGAMKRCLWLMRDIFEAEFAVPSRLEDGTGFVKPMLPRYLPSSEFDLRPATWRNAISSYMALYTSSGEAAYWYPSVAERLAHL